MHTLRGASLTCIALCACQALLDFTAPGSQPSSGDASSADSAAPLGDAAGTEGSRAWPADCDAATSFCDDFDHGDPLETRWKVNAVEGTLATIDAGKSLPNALLASVNAVSPHHAMVTRTLPPAKWLRCSFAANLRDVPPTTVDTNIVFFMMTIVREGVLREIDVTVGAYGAPHLQLGEEGTFPDGGYGTLRDDKLGSIPSAQWMRVRVETDFVTMSVFVDDVLMTPGPVTLVPPLAPGAAAPNIFIGTGNDGEAEPWGILFDDVVCVWEP
jgi:hypothetical protein